MPAPQNPMSHATARFEAERREAVAASERAQAEVRGRVLNRGAYVVARVGTRQGRQLDVVHHAGPRVVQILDANKPLIELGRDQAEQLRDALSAALER